MVMRRVYCEVRIEPSCSIRVKFCSKPQISAKRPDWLIDWLVDWSNPWNFAHQYLYFYNVAAKRFFVVCQWNDILLFSVPFVCISCKCTWAMILDSRNLLVFLTVSKFLIWAFVIREVHNWWTLETRNLIRIQCSVITVISFIVIIFIIVTIGEGWRREASVFERRLT